MLHQIQQTKEAFEQATPKESILKLSEVEQVFEDMMLAKMPEVEISHDCIANENPDYKTINFTTYAGCFIMHPLNYNLSQQQMIDALGEPDQKTADRFKEYFIDKINNTNANKYVQVKEKPTEYVDELIVLPGSDKLKKFVDMIKLKRLRETVPSLGIKPHPLTNEGDYKEQCGFFSNSVNYKGSTDLYDILKKANTIHTTHLSESAMYAAVLHKNIGNIDKYFKRDECSFFHINSLIFGRCKDTAHVNVLKAFSDYRSGVIQPLVDNNWVDKLEKYIDYVKHVKQLNVGRYV